LAGSCPLDRDDIAVIGYDDIPVGAEVEPTLTTMHVPLPEIGERVAMRILEALDGETPSEAIEEVIPTQVVRRDSA
jgi:LacI family transcriptional regulator